jgi:DUF1680 family protein
VRGEGRPVDPVDASEPEDGGRHRRASGSCTHDRIGLALADEVGGEPDPKTLALAKRIRDSID